MPKKRHFEFAIKQHFEIDFYKEIVHSLKQISTYDMWKLHHDYLKRYYWKEYFLWTQGYFVSSVGEVSSERLKEYILNQG